MTDTMTATTVELTICNEAGEDSSTWPSEYDARQHVLNYALMNWSKHLPGAPPVDDERVVAEYFAGVEERGHWFSISVPMITEAAAVEEVAPVDAEYGRLGDGEVRWRTRAGWEIITRDEADSLNAEHKVVEAARAAAFHDAKWLAKYPVGWPAKYRHVLDAVRDVCREYPLFRWTWYKKAGDGPDRPKGSVVFDYGAAGEPSRFVEIYTSIEELAAIVPVPPKPPKPGAATAPKRAVSGRTGKAELVTILRRVVEMTRLGYIDRSIVDEAEALLEKA